MFMEYFGLSAEPFGVTPEPRYLYQSSTHCEALASLKYGFLTNRGFTALIAAPGMGKTTLLYRFLNDIRESARSVFLFDLDMQCDPRELTGYILRDLGIVPGQNSAEMHEQLNTVLLEEAQAGRKLVLVIDEAQNLSPAALETVRLLSNFETPRAKLIQIVLAGQPQLAEKLMQPSLVQLRQRISTVCRLEPLSAEETRAYIEHRLKLAGYSGSPLFTEKALDRLFIATGGVPRLVNNLCFNALSLCRALKRNQVDDAMMAEVIADQQLMPKSEERPAPSSEPPIEQKHEQDNRERTPVLANRWVRAAAVLLGVLLLALFGVSAFHARRPEAPVKVRTFDPPAVTAPPASAPEETPTVHHPAAATPIEITVIPHQTLRDIAVQYLGEYNDARLRQIQALNPTLTDPNHIEAGETIWLPGSSEAPLAESSAHTRSGR